MTAVAATILMLASLQTQVVPVQASPPVQPLPLARPTFVASTPGLRLVEPLIEWRRPLAVGLGISAVLFAGAGVIFGMRAHDAHNRLQAHLAEGRGWDDLAQEQLHTRRRLELTSIGSFVAAGAGAAAAIWLVFGEKHDGPDIRIARANGGWGLALRTKF